MSQPLDLVGASEACALLGLSRGAVFARRRAGDFPEPVAELASGPVWERQQIAQYAKDRAARLYERPGVQALADGAPEGPACGGRGGVPIGERDWYSAADVARMANVPVGRVVALSSVLPCRLAIGGLPRISDQDLPRWLRALAPQREERAPWRPGALYR